jgi:acetyl-CoA C-acetyltransferase
MALDPRTPVIVGVGQMIERPGTNPTFASRATPLELMAGALQRALDDGGHGVTGGVDELIAINSIGWSTPNPARLVADSLGLAVRRTRKTNVGGDVPQKLVNELSRRIIAGELECAAVMGSEAIYAANLARHEGVDTGWEHQEIDDCDVSPQEERVPFSDEEFAIGLAWPTEMYPLFENARRARLGWTLEHQRQYLGQLWSRFAQVAASNPYAWIINSPSASDISTPSIKNRMVGFPYTKLLNANLPVDMGAAFVMMSVSEATRRNISSEQWIFPHCGAEAYDHWFVSQRPRLDDSPAMRSIWSAINGFGVQADDLSLLDLYSCFPTVVQCAAEVINIDPLDQSRAPTVTGGLTFGGGPGNNYVTHSIATMVQRLRGGDEQRGLVTGLGWYSTKHAWGVYGNQPPSAYHFANVQADVDRGETVTMSEATGPVTIESYVVSHRKDGSPKKLVVATRHHDATRSWARSDKLDLMNAFEDSEFIGQAAQLKNGEIFL